MRMVMGNLLETDSDVASISDGERMYIISVNYLNTFHQRANCLGPIYKHYM